MTYSSLQRLYTLTRIAIIRTTFCLMRYRLMFSSVYVKDIEVQFFSCHIRSNETRERSKSSRPNSCNNSRPDRATFRQSLFSKLIWWTNPSKNNVRGDPNSLIWSSQESKRDPGESSAASYWFIFELLLCAACVVNSFFESLLCPVGWTGLLLMVSCSMWTFLIASLCLL